MRVGTKSVLFGVHQFLWHPITVALAFRRVHRRLPSWWEAIGIVFHDIGYWGCVNIDGLSGIRHPYVGAEIAGQIVDLFSKRRGWDVRYFCLYHSSTFAKLCHGYPSNLYLPDKVSLLFDPKWFYLLRARLSGELAEYKARNPKPDWYAWYRNSVQQKLNTHDYHVRKNTPK